MIYAENFKKKIIFFRAVSYFVYFLVSAFAGKTAAFLVAPFFEFFKNDYNVLIFDIVLLSINIIVMWLMILFFSVREGFDDTEKLRFSPKKHIISVTFGVFLFYILLLIFYFFPVVESLRYPVSVFFDVNYFSVYVPFSIIEFIVSNFYITTFVCIASPVGASVYFYGRGRKKWLKTQAEKVRLLKLIRKIEEANKPEEPEQEYPFL